MNQDDRDRKRLEEHQKNPMGNFSESINRSETGDLGELTRGGCLSKIVIILIMIGVFLVISQCAL